ncbi:MAG TPA: sigma factor, partial [Chitinophagaceae bacterium]|nr:sigma factor [Chitinophagaceae bacterium]
MELKIQDSFTLAEKEILDRMLSGEKELYEILIRRNNALLYRIGRSYGLSHVDVQDVMQETYLAAYQQLRNFQRRSSFTTWIIRIM